MHFSLNGVDFGDTLPSFLFCLFVDTQRRRGGEGEIRISKQHMLVWLYPNLTNHHEEANILPIRPKKKKKTLAYGNVVWTYL